MKAYRAAMAILQAQRNIFTQEKIALERAIEDVQQAIIIQARKKQDPLWAKYYNAAHTKYRTILDAAHPTAPEQLGPLPKIYPPQTHEDPQVNIEIQEGYQKLLDERKAFFRSMRMLLQHNQALSSGVREHLISRKFEAVWGAVDQA